MNSISTHKNTAILISLTLSAGLIYAVGSGIQSSYGIMLKSICSSSGISYSSVSFVLAIGQLMYGLTQPFFGLLALKKSNAFVLAFGAILTAAGLIAMPYCKSELLLLISLGIALPSGIGALSFGIIMSALSPAIPERFAAAISGIVTASSGIGSCVLSPIIQSRIAAGGLSSGVFFLAISALILLPVSLWLCKKRTPLKSQPQTQKLRAAALFREAFRSRNYRRLMAGFFTCGFHMAIIELHLYSQFTSYGIADDTASYAFSVYGIITIAGSILSGAACSRFRMKHTLGTLYAFRAALTLWFLLSPKTVYTAFVFIALLGMTGNATVVPTSGLIEKEFGAHKLGTLFGFTFLCHQLGSFISAWLGGILISVTGSYNLIWVADAVLCVLAACASFTIKENRSLNMPAALGKEL